MLLQSHAHYTHLPCNLTRPKYILNILFTIYVIAFLLFSSNFLDCLYHSNDLESQCLLIGTLNPI